MKLWPVEHFYPYSEWPVCSFAKMIHSWGNHFGKGTAWSLIYFLNYAYLNILAQSQILVISLYFFLSWILFFKTTFRLFDFIIWNVSPRIPAAKQCPKTRFFLTYFSGNFSFYGEHQWFNINSNFSSLDTHTLKCLRRGCPIIIWTGLNIKIDIVQKL